VQIPTDQTGAIKAFRASRRDSGSSPPITPVADHQSDMLPFPETKPTTIDGWTVRDVLDGTAILEGPNGVFRAPRGYTVPGVGRVESIVRWGNRWIVATSAGLISTP
jgi:hypothetical protein